MAVPTNTVNSGQTIVLTSNATLGAYPVVFNGGTLQAGAANLDFTNATSVNSAGGTFDVDGQTLTWGGAITDGSGTPAGVLTVTDSSGSTAGTLVLDATNTYSGGTLLTGGATLSIDHIDGDGNVDALGTGVITISSGSTLQNGAGAFIDLANNITVGSGGAILKDDTNHDGFELDGAISGAGQLTLTGGNFYTFGSAGTFSGTTLITGDSILLAGTNSLAHASDFKVDLGSTLRLNGLSSNTIGSLADGPNGGGQVYDSSQSGHAAILTLGDANDTAFSGQIEDSNVAGGVLSLIKQGTGTFTESGANLYSGGTMISAGGVAVTQSTFSGGVETSSSVGSGAVIFDGGRLIASADGLTFNNAALINSTAGSNGFYLNGNTLTWGGTISDGTGAPTALVVQGSGDLVLGHANTFSGGLNIENATVQFDDGNELGTGTISFSDGINRDGSPQSVLDSTTAGATITNDINIPVVGQGESTSRGLIEGSNVTLSGAITGSGSLNLGDGASVTLSHADAGFDGRITLGLGSTLTAGVDNFAAQSSISFGTNDIFNLNGHSQTLQYLSGYDSSSGTIENTGGAAATLTVTEGGFAGTIIDGGAGLALIKSEGSGELDLQGANTYSGGTTLEGGHLILDSATAGAFGAITSGAAGTGAITFAGASTLFVEAQSLDQTTHELYYQINGFTTGDTLDVQDEAGSVDSAIYSATAGTLTLTNGGTTEAILHIGTGYAGDTFTAMDDDGDNGTAITVSIPAPSGGGGGGGGGTPTPPPPPPTTDQGSSGNDNLTANSGGDTVAGGGGNDSITGGTGHDMLYGNTGNDTIVLTANTDTSTVFGGQGDDVINASASTHSNFLSGDLGNDYIIAGAGNDTAYAGDGADSIVGGSGHDQLYGNMGNDYVYLQAANAGSTVFGGQGDDVIDASATTHGQFLSGDAGIDIILGGQGGDTIHGGSGSDTIEAAAGATTFIHAGLADSSVASATDMSQLDHVTGFGANDSLVFDGDPAGTSANTLIHHADSTIANYAAAYAYAYGSTGHAAAVTGAVEYVVVDDTAGHTYVFAANHAAIELDGLTGGAGAVTSGQLLGA